MDRPSLCVLEEEEHMLIKLTNTAHHSAFTPPSVYLLVCVHVKVCGCASILLPLLTMHVISEFKSLDQKNSGTLINTIYVGHFVYTFIDDDDFQ